MTAPDERGRMNWPCGWCRSMTPKDELTMARVRELLVSYVVYLCRSCAEHCA